MCVPQDRACTIVANHTGFLDILFMMASDFPSFVAKVCTHKNDPITAAMGASDLAMLVACAPRYPQACTRRIPMIGSASRCMQCVYVQPRTPGSTYHASDAIVERQQMLHNPTTRTLANASNSTVSPSPIPLAVCGWRSLPTVPRLPRRHNNQWPWPR